MSKTIQSRNEALGDFTATPRMIAIAGLAIAIALVATYVAWALLKLIGLFTNLFYYGRIDTALSSPAHNHLGWFAALVPVAGALIVGVMARYGSERIRGHGIPEALESILLNGSKVQPRLAVLKPFSAAISIGSGGPFGAEGPIIMTGGAIGSIFAQLFHLTALNVRHCWWRERRRVWPRPLQLRLRHYCWHRTLLFELKPRSAIPVALASATAGAARRYILGLGPLFPVPHHAIFIGPQGLLGCVIAGLLAGGLSSLLTPRSLCCGGFVSRNCRFTGCGGPPSADFHGLGGMIFPQALGVGYDTIGAAAGRCGTHSYPGVLLVKSAIRVISLGSGTSGGVLAPLLMMGAALGGVDATFLPIKALGSGRW